MLARLALIPLALAAALAHAGVDPDRTLADARKAVADQTAAGLKSLTARLTITSHASEDLSLPKQASFVYRWTAPATEAFEFDKTPGEWTSGLRQALTQAWRPLTGALVYSELPKISELTGERVRGARVLTGVHANGGPVELVVDRQGRLAEVRFMRRPHKWVYRYAKLGKQWRVATVETHKGARRVLTLALRAPAQRSGYWLPTALVVTGADEQEVALTIDYEAIDGKQVTAGDARDAADTLKATVNAVQQGWRGWTADEKARQLAALGEFADDRASATVARLGLSDRDLAVREAAAKTLARMKRKNVTLTLTAHLRPNAKNERVYRQLCLALAELNDHRAVPALSKNWWRDTSAGPDGLRARIYALGKIRHVDSIDALMGILYVTDSDGVGQYKDVILHSLRNLTGQDFGEDRRGWRNWWKANQRSFRFPDAK